MLDNETVSTNPKDFIKEGPKPKDGEGPLPLRAAKPKVGDKLRFADRMWVIRKITKKDMLIRPING